MEIGSGGGTRALARILTREVDPVVGKLLEEDLVSDDTNSRQKAAEVLGSLGPAAIPLLVNVIKQERDVRIRQVAASLMADIGPPAAKQLKRELMLEVTIEQRFRILEVMDTVTHVVKDELVYCLGDGAARIRLAACQLAERIGDPAFIEIFAPHTESPDIDVAKAAIRCLANLGSVEASKILAEALRTSAGSDHAVACAKALGQIGDPTAIPALVGVLSKKKYLFFGWRWDGQVRATAAMALGEISDLEAEKALARFEVDPQQPVRQMARAVADRRLPAP